MLGQSFQRLIPVVGNNPCHFGSVFAFFGIGIKPMQWRQTLSSPSRTVLTESTLRAASSIYFLGLLSSDINIMLDLERQPIYSKFLNLYGYFNNMFVKNTPKPLLRLNFSSGSFVSSSEDSKDDKKKVDEGKRSSEDSKDDKTKVDEGKRSSEDSKDGKKKVDEGKRSSEDSKDDEKKVDEGKIGKGMNCPHCGLGFTSHEELQAHIDNTGVKRGGCRKLWRKKNEEDVRAGILKHVCQECGIGFKWNSQLETHKRFHRKDRPYECKQCDKAYKTAFGLNQHMKDAHSEGYPCPECGKHFTTKGNMEKHLKNVCLAEEHRFKCVECGETFSLSENLKTHIKMVHERQRLFTCDECGSDFSSKQYLELHKRRVHDNIRDHECEDCGKEFKTAKDLQNHRIRKHTSDWPYICQVCAEKGVTKGFIYPFELKKHMQTRHPTKI